MHRFLNLKISLFFLVSLFPFSLEARICLSAHGFLNFVHEVVGDSLVECSDFPGDSLSSTQCAPDDSLMSYDETHDMRPLAFALDSANTKTLQSAGGRRLHSDSDFDLGKDRDFRNPLSLDSSLSLENITLGAKDLSLKIDSLLIAPRPKRRVWRAIGEGVFVNTFVWAADRWILGKDYYSKGWSTFKDNLDKGWSFDADAFSTNFIDHPYHGNLYYTGARTSGCNFWLSTLLTAVGSLEWEEIAETDFPSYNDFFATTFGGAVLGELTLRVSDLILNNKRRGFNRVAREVIAFGLAPMRGINRMIDGDMWRHQDTHYLYHDKSEIPYRFMLSVGGRWAETRVSPTRCNTSFNIFIDYGKYGDTRQNRPFDCFRADLAFNKAGTHVPLVSSFCINARIHGWQLSKSEHSGTVFSVNQDFVYYNNEQQERVKYDRRALFCLSEPAAFGPAITFEAPSFRHTTTANAVLMSGFTSDNYYRSYNMGSGFNAKMYNLIRLSDVLYLNLDASFHYLFTWEGYEKEQIDKFKAEGKEPPYTLQTMVGRKGGEKCYATFFVLHPRLDLKLFKNVYASAQLRYFTRNSVYKYYDNVKSHYSDFNLSLTYKIQ